VLLEALIATDPKNDSHSKIVTGLLAHRKAGRWTNTQENAFVLLALDRYFRTYEAVTPDFVARVWLGDRFAGERAFRGRSTDRAHLEIPMNMLAGPQATSVTLAKAGPAASTTAWGFGTPRRASRSRRSIAGSPWSAATRRFDAPADVVREADGGWRIKAGARVRVRLDAGRRGARGTTWRWSHPLPAGLEPLNPRSRSPEACGRRLDG